MPTPSSSKPSIIPNPLSRKRRDDVDDMNSKYSTTKRLAFCEPQLATGASSHHVLLATTTPLPAATATSSLQPPIKQRRMAASQVLTSDHPYHQHDAVFRAPVNNDANRAAVKSVANGSVSNFEVGTQQQPNSVLRTIIENMMFPVSLEVLHQLFARYGKVLRIITFNKNNTFQALIQMSEANSAQLAKQGLENQNVYNGCCTLRIDYSKLSTLNVKYNNDKSRDYTNPNLPPGEMTLEQQIAISTIPGLQNLIPTNPYNFAFGANPATTFLTNQLATATAAATDSANAAALAPYLNPLGLGSANLATSIPAMRFPMLNLTPVILVSNLHEMKVTTDALFTLFGVYGDVMRVKILYNKKDNALIQYSEPQQAQLALTHLDKVKWHDRLIRVAPSKHTNVQMPKEGQPDAGLTRDYAHSTLHRFKKPGSKNYLNIYPPCATLHLSNIPATVSEDKLKEMFLEAGYAVKAFKFFPKDHKMALCQLEDIETAIDALIKMHNQKLAENAHLRVSFSKSGI
ncbi:hypothetical protein B9Z55_005728 [Caenorhabditis nigoni]|uniref:RRM domain-containing protein n=1 Tax=Caenorhabditis nigoni TaxID=1611254 RepID=A0A2G5V2J2_9PELO|nr:hypothetical protein B9Z55_005728 [Caenorhabditis nigoni]